MNFHFLLLKFAKSEKCFFLFLFSAEFVRNKCNMEEVETCVRLVFFIIIIASEADETQKTKISLSLA